MIQSKLQLLLLPLAVLALLGTNKVLGESLTDPLCDIVKEPTTIRLAWENDTFAGTDRFYTNGVRLDMDFSEDLAPSGFGIGLLVQKTPSLLWLIGKKDRQAFFSGLHLAQNMYTPSTIEDEVPDPNDRPYGGWLYGGLHFTRIYDSTLNYKLGDSLAINLGVIGPASLAEEAQKGVHEIVDSAEPQGWDSQLDNEPGIDINYQAIGRRTLLGENGSWSLQGIGNVGANLGTVFIQGRLGGQLRMGYNMPDDFGAAPMTPTNRGNGEQDSAKWSFSIFGGMEGRSVAHNAFLDGGTFRDGPSVDKKPFVHDLFYGVALGHSKGHEIGYINVTRSKEFDGQDSTSTFGSIYIRFAF